MLNARTESEFQRAKSAFDQHNTAIRAKRDAEREIAARSRTLYEEAEKLEREGKVDQALTLYRQNIDTFTPVGPTQYQRPAIMLERAGRYEEAMEICDIAIARSQQDPQKYEFLAAAGFERRRDRLAAKVKAQSDPSVRKSEIHPSARKPDLTQAVIPAAPAPDFLSGDAWQLSISFGRSSSPNYGRALALAKAAPEYIESKDDRGNFVHQAIYGPKDSEFLAACQLHELVEGWQSSFVFINGKPVDRRIFGQVKYCYGDRCRSGKTDFCFGASEFTANPFGCHRAMIHATNDPWWTFTEQRSDGHHYVQKERLAKELVSRLRKVYICPVLDVERAVEAVASLPDRLSTSELETLQRGSLYGPAHAEVSSTLSQASAASVVTTEEPRTSPIPSGRKRKPEPTHYEEMRREYKEIEYKPKRQNGWKTWVLVIVGAMIALYMWLVIR